MHSLQQILVTKVRGVFVCVCVCVCVCISWWWNQFLLKICLCLLSWELFDLSQNYIKPWGCCSKWRKPPGTHLFPIWPDCGMWRLHLLLCAIWTGIFTVFPSHYTPHYFGTGHKLWLSSWSQNAAVSRYLLEGLNIMSSCSMRMPLRVIIVIATKQKQTTAQGYA